MNAFFPPILLGILLIIYWGRVLRMAFKSHRRSGRAGNIVPAERLGRALRIVWVPVVLIWIVLPFVNALGRKPPPLVEPLFYSSIVAWPAVIIAGVCLALSFFCWKAMGREWRMGIDPAERNALIANGPFACVRHPIYALSMLMMLATMVTIPSPLMLLAGTCHIALLAWEARREEKHLLNVHGQAYADYARRVGPFFPKLLASPRHAAKTFS